MSFFDTFKDTGGKYLKEAEKDVLMENGIAFEITGLVFDEQNKYGARWVAQCHGPDPSSETIEEGDYNISFPYGTVESRDRMLSEMSKYLEREDAEPVMVKLTLKGRSKVLVPA